MADEYIPMPWPGGVDFLTYLQNESQLWREHSFPPEHRTAPLQALGVCEEAGELAHAVLKLEQGIRGTEEEHKAAAMDAVGDVIVYLAGVCSSLGLSLQDCVQSAWGEVQERDWSKHKADGTERTQTMMGQCVNKDCKLDEPHVPGVRCIIPEDVA